MFACGRDSTIYSATCASLGEQPVAVKLYNKDRVSAPKLRAIKREAAMMSYITRKQYATRNSQRPTVALCSVLTSACYEHQQFLTGCCMCQTVMKGAVVVQLLRPSAQSPTST